MRLNKEKTVEILCPKCGKNKLGSTTSGGRRTWCLECKAVLQRDYMTQRRAGVFYRIDAWFFRLARKIRLAIHRHSPPSTEELEFRARLRSLRASKGFSQKGLARAAGIANTCIWKWETGQQKPTLKHLNRVAAVLGVNPKELRP